MDYDDNDFQSPNLQLAGEGSNKFPPVLRPYALSKFDFEDSLHGHLRFDGLIETEGFLGIESNEDNQWIEDFSRANSGIGFNTSAAESCSIPRQENVWSEATSSESVEMLLKSVGQDDIIPGQTVTRESDACDELGCIIKQMEPSSKHEDSSFSRVEDVIGLNPTLQPAEIPEASSELKNDLGAEQPLVEDASKTEAGDSVDGDLNSPSTGSENANTAVTDGSEPVADKQIAVHQKEVSTSVDESPDISRKEDSFASSQLVTTVSTLNNTSTGSAVLGNQDDMCLKNDVGDKETDSLDKDFEIDHRNLDYHLVPSGTSPVDNSSASEREFKADGNMITTSVIFDPSITVVKEVSDFHVVEGSSEAVHRGVPAQATQSDELVLSKDSVVGDHSVGNLHDTLQTPFGDNITGPKGQDGETGNNSIEICTSSESEMDSMVQITCNQSATQEEQFLESSGQLDTKGLTGKSEESLLSLEDSKVSKGEGDGNSKSYEGGISSLDVDCSSVKLTMTQTNTTSEDIQNTSEVCGAESTKICEENIINGNSDAYKGDQRVFIHGKQSTELPNDGSNTECGDGQPLVVDEEVCSQSFIGGNITLVSKFQSNAVGGVDSDGLPLPSAEGAPTDAVDKLVPLVQTPANKEKGSVDPTIMLKTSLSNLKVSPDKRTESYLVSESGEGASCDAGDEFSCKAVDKSLTVVDASNSSSQSDQQAALPPAVSKECSKEIGKSTIFPDSTVKESGRDEAKVISEKHEEGDNEEKHGNASLKVTDSELTQRKNNQMPSSNNTGQDGGEDNETASISGDKSSERIVIPSTDMESGCSSPIVIRTSEPSQGEAEKERIKESTEQNGHLSGVVDGVSKDPKGNANDISAGDRSFTFEVLPLADLSEKEAGKNWQPFPSMQQGKPHLKKQSVGGSPSTSSLSQVDIKTTEDASHGNLKAPDKEIVRSGSKGSSERKTRRVSSKSTGKEAARKGNPVKETTPSRQSVRRDRKGNASVSSSAISQLVHSGEIPHYGRIEGGSMKPFGVLSSSVSSLPDLNTATSSSAMFHQPFTDLQQVQLRAQIFVYGALIQGITPDEAYMISAFGGPDGGRSLWEKNWHACIERLHGQKSHPTNPETPLQSHLGAKTDQAIKQNALQNKVTSSPASRATSKGTPTTIVNPMIPLSSPLWSVPTTSSDALQPAGLPRVAVMDYQPALPPLHPHQTPPIRNYANPPWVSQSPFRAPWVPQTAALDTGARFPLMPTTEPVSLTPARESLGPQSSGAKQVSPIPVVQSGSPANVLAGTPLFDTKKAIVTPSQHSAEPKSRKRKKVPAPEESGQVILKPQSQTATHSVPVSTSCVSPAVSIIAPNTIVSKSSNEKFIIPVSPTITPVHLQKVDRDAGQKASLSEETHSKLTESQVHTVDAAALATVAVSHCQEIWNELNKHKNSGLAIDIETQLTSAAVAIAAAAAVAKAAAAAANVASNAALQAKLMADEALVSIASRSDVQTNEISNNGVKILGQPPPASILKGEDATNRSNSIIIAAREAARRRVEAASSASKHAENMAAIVKAAELAAEAVSQAGTIVAMGEPFSLSQLVQAGPEAYWRLPKVSSEQVRKSNDVNREQLGRGGHEEGQGASAAHSKEVSLEKETQSGNHGSSTSGKDKKRQKGCIAPDLAKTIGAVHETEYDLRSSPIATHEKEVETIKEMNIEEGSLVEILRVGGGSKVAWFLANVLSLRDGKACVCYHELQSEDDGDKLKEWVELKAEREKAPRIRIARPMTAVPFEGTRKRRRAAMADYNWAIGDRVDAWMQDSWWEGVITEKNKKDETSLTVHFPAQGETSVVKAWHLRHSQIWKDGRWVECSISGDNSFTTHEGDTPQEKRPRLGSPPVEAKGKHKVSKGTGVMESEKPDDTRLLDLAASERIFNIGKNTRDDSKPDSMRRTGLRKEGSRVVFGIPKPGKKRKFMEVSKHYVSDQSKKNLETNDSVKFPKYLMPQGAGTRTAKGNSESEPKAKQMAVSKPRVLKSGKPPSVSARTTSKKDNFSNASVFETDDDDTTDVSKSKDSVSHDENASGKHNMMEFRSFSTSEGAAEGPILFSSAGLPSDATASKKTSTSNAKSERMSKGKLALAAGKLAKIEEEKVSNGNSTKPTIEVLEPRRSNRRIQPTSRLLEGLQSSLIISKIPSVPHNKGHRTQSRSAKRE